MNKNIVLAGQVIVCEIKRSRRAKRLRLAVHHDGLVVLTLPWRLRAAEGEKFIRAKAAWIVKQVAFFQKHVNLSVTKITKADYVRNQAAARRLVEVRLAYFNKIYQLPFKKITIKNQKTRWGSCSRRGHLNFNFRLVFLPAVLADYIIVHELCHLREMNHSPRFWALVSKTFPNYPLIRQQLQTISPGLL